MISTEGPPPAPRNKDWTLSAERLELLLSGLDRDRDCAAEKYLLLRQKLDCFFSKRHRSDPLKSIDKVIDVLAAKLGEGVKPRNLLNYALGIARNVALEKDLPEITGVAEDIFESEPANPEDTDKPRDPRWVDLAFSSIGQHGKELLKDYYPTEKPTIGLPAHRRKLAQSLEISDDLLRQRIQGYKEKFVDTYHRCRKRAVL